MNMTRKPATRVQTMLMAILLWPTVSITSASCGFAASFTGTSLAPPVVAPLGSLTGAGALVCAWACAVSGRATTDTRNASANETSNTRVTLTNNRMWQSFRDDGLNNSGASLRRHPGESKLDATPRTARVDTDHAKSGAKLSTASRYSDKREATRRTFMLL